MFNRPRCRDWTALATQQLRLRNLIQVSGHNIVCDSNSTIYFTLHLTSMSAPCFTGERLEYRKNIIWPEINCQSILKSTSHCVCIRVWQRQRSLLNYNIDNDDIEIATQGVDKVLFLWGVYFSGLVAISRRTDVKLKTNALVFHIHGGFFTSPEYLLPESIPRQLQISGIDRKRLCALIWKCNNVKYDEISVTKSYVSTLTCSNLPGKNFEVLNDESEQDDKVDLNANHLKVRFIEKHFFKSEIRNSYDLKKLLLLQEKQRQIRYRTDSAKEQMEKICMRSAFCVNLELIANNALKYRSRNNTSMGRTLNRLLFQPVELPKPEILLKAQEIKQKIETAKFRCRLLLLEKNQGLIHVRKLEHKLGDISDANNEQETWLLAKHRGLNRDKSLNLEESTFSNSRIEFYTLLLNTLEQRRQQLLRELKEIYLIKTNDKGMLTINDAALPNAESYIDMVSPSDVSVALGYSAHITLMCSVILDCPLR